MNAIGMVMQNSSSTEVRTPTSKNGNKTEGATQSFPALLKEGTLVEESNSKEQQQIVGKQSIEEQSNPDEVLQADLLALLEGLGIDLNALSSDQSESITVAVEDLTGDLESELVDSDVLSTLITFGFNPMSFNPMNMKVQDSNVEVTNALDLIVQSLNLVENLNHQLDPAELVKIQQQLTEILSKLDNLLSGITGQEDIKKAAPKILEMLQKWTELESKLLDTNTNDSAVKLTAKLEENTALKELIVAYQNRSKLTSKQQYNSDSQVTTKDVVKWIENVMQNQQITDKVAPMQTINFNSNAAMPKLEQFVIFVNQNQGGQTVEQQFVEQFQQVMKTSKFLSMPNGVNQLSIALRPDNLGEMMVRLVQVNGEMTVKILVTSQAAKEMLESNINQLKHMFSPQQVVIERQDINAGQGQNQTKQNDEQTLNGQNQSQSEQSGQQESNKHEDDFESHLQEMILNEEV